MVSNLTDEHFTLIRNFSRKVTKGRNADDLSQHVILKLLQKDTNFINGLIDRGDEFNRFVWRFINRMFMHSGSTFNRIETGTHDVKQRKIMVGFDDYKEKAFVDVSNHTINPYRLIKNAGLTDLERMYLNAWIDNGMSFKVASRELDICRSTISKHVNKALKKCRESL